MQLVTIAMIVTETMKMAKINTKARAMTCATVLGGFAAGGPADGGRGAGGFAHRGPAAGPAAWARGGARRRAWGEPGASRAGGRAGVRGEGGPYSAGTRWPASRLPRVTV